MRVKDCYSLQVDELIDEVPTTDNLPAHFDGGIDPVIVRGNYEESLNIFEAFADYIVERNRTRNMSRQFAAAESALDARNDEARRQSEIILDGYAERLKNFLEAKRQEFELNTRRIEMESAAQVEQLQNERERQHRKTVQQIELLEYYRSFLDEAQKFLAEVENSPEKFMSRNKFYYQVKEDCRIKMKWVLNLIKNFDR